MTAGGVSLGATRICQKVMSITLPTAGCLTRLSAGGVVLEGSDAVTPMPNMEPPLISGVAVWVDEQNRSTWPAAMSFKAGPPPR